MSERDAGSRLLGRASAREELRQKLDRYLDLPLALASVVVVLLIVIKLSGEVSEPWQTRIELLGWGLWSLFFLEFAVKFALAPKKRTYLRRNWLDVLVLLLPFLRFLRVLENLRATRVVPALRLVIFGAGSSENTLALLKRRRLGQLATISVMVILIGAALGFPLENGAPGSTVKTSGDALWWASTIVTTVASELYPVTVGGRVLGFLLMLYAIGVFSYFIGAISSVLVESDARKTPETGENSDVRLDERELVRCAPSWSGPRKGTDAIAHPKAESARRQALRRRRVEQVGRVDDLRPGRKGVRHPAVLAEDVLDGKAVYQEGIGDHAPVAPPPHRLQAHEADPSISLA